MKIEDDPKKHSNEDSYEYPNMLKFNFSLPKNEEELNSGLSKILSENMGFDKGSSYLMAMQSAFWKKEVDESIFSKNDVKGLFSLITYR